VPSRAPVPVVATLLDLAPWELPERYARTAPARLASRQRAATFASAARVLVCSRATAEAATRLLGLAEEVVRVVPLAADDAFHPGAADGAILTRLRTDHAIPERYLVVGGRWDARSDLPTLLEAVAIVRETAERAEDGAAPTPPVVVLAGAAGHDPAGPSRVAALVERHRVTDLVRLTPPLSPAELGALEAAAVGHVQPALSDANGLAALDALATGIPVIASRTGPLPEIVGPAGIIVEPRDAGRMAMALHALWSGGPVARQVTRAAQQRAGGVRRRWSDVAADTRRAYAEAVGWRAP
jgi:glycosyltransferase involved in cell wall biosynthesis